MTCELDTCESHGDCGLLERSIGTIEIQRDRMSRLPYRVLVCPKLFYDAKSEHLGIAIAEVEARGFEHKPLESDDDLGVVFKQLQDIREKPTKPNNKSILAESSGVSCSDGETFIL